MDEMNLLREFGRELEHEPPASLARQRDRLPGRRRGFFARPRGWLLIGGVAAVTAAALVAPTVLLDRHVGEEIPLVDTADAPAKLSADTNVLFLGSDDRAGTGGKYGKAEGARSDTIMLAHIPKDGTKVRVVSFPRDLMVEIPSCRKPGAFGTAAHIGPINEAYAIGGAACVFETVQSVTGIHLDHVVEVGFNGVKELTDAVGGVEVVLPKAVNDPASGLRLSAGRHTVRGETALAYVRIRHGLGDGSDLARVKRQQEFMVSLLERVRPSLTDPVRLVKLLRAVSGAVKSDEKLTIDRMVSILSAIGGAKGTARFSTVPFVPDRADMIRLRLKQPQAETLFRTLR